MQLIVRSLDRTVALTASPADSLTSIRQRLLAVYSGHVVDSQRFVFAGRTLDEAKTLGDYSIGESSVLDLVPRLFGGVMEPTLINLAREYNQNMMICRHCYARNPLRATNCRRCRGTNLRKKKLEVCIRRYTSFAFSYTVAATVSLWISPRVVLWSK